MRTVAGVNAEHGSCSTVSRIPGATQLALAAARIYLADDATTNQPAIRPIFDDADKLVTDRPIETGVPARNLEIGVADPGQQHTHQRFTASIGFPYILY